jgi:hypothetical protein
MSSNHSKSQICEMINNGQVYVAKAKDYTTVYEIKSSVINDHPKVGVKRKYPFDINGQNQPKCVKKYRQN